MGTAVDVVPASHAVEADRRSRSAPARASRSLVVVVMLLAVTATSVAAAVAALLLAGGRPVAAPLGLPDAGALVGWAVRLGRLLAELLAVMTVGALLVGAVLLPDRSTYRTAVQRSVRSAGRCAVAWAVLAISTALLTVADTAGMPLARLSPTIVRELGTTGTSGALLVMAAFAATVALGAPFVTDSRGSRLLLLVAVAGLLPLALVGHASSAADHDVATSGLVVHVAAAAVWVGGLVGILLHLRTERDALAAAVGRFSPLALGAFLALGVSGLLTALTRLGGSPSAWTSGYGALVVAKVAALVVLGVLGHLHRRRTILRIAAGRPRAFLGLAGAELLVMGAAMGMAAALSRTPAPPLPVADPAHGSGHVTLPTSIAPISLAELATHWRMNALVLLVLGVLLAAYLGGVRELARRGVRWSRTHTSFFVAGLLVALVDLCSGVATYAPAMVSMQLIQFLVALVVVPLLLMLGAPLTLLLQVGRTERHALALLQSRVGALLANPATGATAVFVLLLGVYRTSFIELSLRSFWVHLLVLVLALVSGLILMWPALAIDPLPRLRSLGDRAGSVATVIASLLLLAAQLRFGDRLLAGRWFLELRWGWVDPVADQRFAGAVVALVAVATVLVMAVAARRDTPPA